MKLARHSFAAIVLFGSCASSAVAGVTSDGLFVTSSSDGKRVETWGRSMPSRMPSISVAEFRRMSRGGRATPDTAFLYSTQDSRFAGKFVRPTNAGTSGLSYTTALVEPMSDPIRRSTKDVATSAQPFLSTGKLFVKKDGEKETFCSASLIGKGLVITSAGCVAEYQKGTIAAADDVYFIPAATRSENKPPAGPLQRWQAAKIVVPACYSDGSCLQVSNDIALIGLKKNDKKKLPGQVKAGHYGISTSNYTFASNPFLKATYAKSAQVTQLGYPTGIGAKKRMGAAMVRTDALAIFYKQKDYSYIAWGTPQLDGSQGGPVLVNFGTQAKYAKGVPSGRLDQNNMNVIVGVTSTIVNLGKYQQASLASAFGTNKNYPSSSYKDDNGKDWGPGNIGALLRQMCGKGANYFGLTSLCDIKLQK